MSPKAKKPQTNTWYRTSRRNHPNLPVVLERVVTTTKFDKEGGAWDRDEAKDIGYFSELWLADHAAEIVRTAPHD